MPPRFHQATFDLIGERPAADREARALLKRRESELGRPFPESLREWYGLKGAVEILERFSNRDHPVPLEELGTPDPEGPPDAFRVLDENQGAGSWYVRPDGSDDPPVEVLTAFQDPDDPTTAWEWAREADTFSAFVRGRVLNYGGARDLRNVVKTLKKLDAFVTFRPDGGLDEVSFSDGEPIGDAALDLLAGLEMDGLTFLKHEITAEGWGKLARIRRVGKLYATGETFDDRALDVASAIPGLASLYLWTTSAGGPAVARALSRSAITFLNLAAEGLATADFLAIWPACGALEWLIVHQRPLADDALEGLAGLPRLERLILSHTEIGDAGVAHLRDLPRLESLELRETRVEGSGLRHLGEFPSLRRLNLVGTPLNDDGAAIVACRSLEVLEVAATRLTDRGVAEFARLPGLRSLDLRGLSLAEATIDALHAARPDLRIER